MFVDIGCVERELICAVWVDHHECAGQMYGDYLQWRRGISIRSQVAPPAVAPSDSLLRLVLITDKVLGGRDAACIDDA